MNNSYLRRSPKFAPKRVAPIVRCRVCGCTDQDCSQCVEKTGSSCFWFEPDLCSACVPKIYLTWKVGIAHIFVRTGRVRSLCNHFAADVEADHELVLFRIDDLDPGPNGCRFCFNLAKDFIDLTGKAGAA